MKVIVTAGEVSDHFAWADFCELKGIDQYALANGLDRETEYAITLQESVDLGLITVDNIRDIQGS